MDAAIIRSLRRLFARKFTERHNYIERAAYIERSFVCLPCDDNPRRKKKDFAGDDSLNSETGERPASG